MSGTPTPPGGVRGQWVVLVMLAFGMTLTAILWLYWDRHTAPFRDLQDALAREFPRSKPRVEGGQRKMHKGDPRILRIVLKVEFNPQAKESEAEAVADRAVELARQHHDLTRYDEIEIHLYWPEPEREIVEWEITRPVPEAEGDGRGSKIEDR